MSTRLLQFVCQHGTCVQSLPNDVWTIAAFQNSTCIVNMRWRRPSIQRSFPFTQSDHLFTKLECGQKTNLVARHPQKMNILCPLTQPFRTAKVKQLRKDRSRLYRGRVKTHFEAVLHIKSITRFANSCITLTTDRDDKFVKQCFVFVESWHFTWHASSFKAILIKARKNFMKFKILRMHFCTKLQAVRFNMAI